MFRGILATVGVALLLVTAGCAGSLNPATASANVQQANQTEGGQSISVVASGQAQAQPDQAVLRIAVVASGDNANVVREQLASNASQMQAALAEIGIPDDRIRTVAYRIDQRHDQRTTTENRPQGFEGYHAFEITLSNVSNAGAVIDTAVSNGADRVDSVELMLSEERRRAIREEALRDAMDNARSNAGVIADSANLTITGVHSASTGDVSFYPVRAETLEAGATSDAATNVESGPVTVSAQVQVTYNATG